MSEDPKTDEIEQLRTTVAKLTLLNAFKTKQADHLEKKYSQTIAILNDYINQLHKVLNMKTSGDADSIPISKLMSVLKNDDMLQTEDFIIIPKKLIKEHKSSEKDVPETKTISVEETKQEVPNGIVPNLPVAKKGTRKQKSKMTCSHCNELGHKRSQCPKILYKDV